MERLLQIGYLQCGEIDYCLSKKNAKYQHFAARFAAKEAVYKAISPDNNDNINWKDIEIVNNTMR